ncbi:MAG: DUF2752 domain-containing protein [Rhodomicrobium sp.]
MPVRGHAMWRFKMVVLFGAFATGPTIVTGTLGRSVGMQGLPSFCLFKALTGLDCPACGITRSVSALCDFDLTGSFALHPGGPFVAALVLSLFIYFLVTLLSLGKYGLSLGTELAALNLSSRMLLPLLFIPWLVKMIYLEGG